MRGHIRALMLQHTYAVASFVHSVELFVLSPLKEKDDSGATYSILVLSPRYKGSRYCVPLKPSEIGLPVKEAQVTFDPASEGYCFNSGVLEQTALTGNRGSG